MPVPNARAFLKRRIEPGPSREEGQAVLKEKLLMLAAQKNHDEEQTKLVELCSTISIDDNESVDNFIVEAQRVRCMEENVLVALTSEAFEDGFEVVNLDPTPEEEDERFYNEDATISEAEEPDINEIMMGGGARVTSDYIFHHKIWEDESNKPFIVKVPHEHRQDVPTSDTTPVNTSAITHDVPTSDAISVNTAATTTHKLASLLATKLVSSKAKLTTTQAKLKAGAAKQTTANAKRFLEYRAEKIKRKEVATNERLLKKISEAAVNTVLKEEAQKKKAEKAAKAAAEAAVNAVLKEEAQKNKAEKAAARQLLKQKEVEKV